MSHRNPSGPAPIVRLSALVLVAVCLVPVPALAYIDPGTGSFVLQGILAAVVGVGVAAKVFWHRIANFFGKRKPDADDDLDG